ncbi:hypothetical protein [Candidatus Nitrospira nitrosa]|nr:hypothetical protein [Candidatus Nitrospira nitrosa]
MLMIWTSFVNRTRQEGWATIDGMTHADQRGKGLGAARDYKWG